MVDPKDERTQIVNLLSRLDDISHRNDRDYGLPLYDQGLEPEMVQAVRDFAAVWQARSLSAVPADGGAAEKEYAVDDLNSFEKWIRAHIRIIRDEPDGSAGGDYELNLAFDDNDWSPISDHAHVADAEFAMREIKRLMWKMLTELRRARAPLEDIPTKKYLGYCNTPHHLENVSGDGRSLEQSSHAQEDSCREWMVDPTQFQKAVAPAQTFEETPEAWEKWASNQHAPLTPSDIKAAFLAGQRSAIAEIKAWADAQHLKEREIRAAIVYSDVMSKCAELER